MDRKDIIKGEMLKASQWTHHLLRNFDSKQQFSIPNGTKSNINWQIGHMLISRYFHAVICVAGSQAEFKEKVPIREYVKLYSMGTKPEDNFEVKPDLNTLLEHLKMTDQLAIDLLENLDDDILDTETLKPSPVAKTKFEALMWSSTHQMWHNGQIALLKNLIS